MTDVEKLLIEVQKLGYRTRTTGESVIIEIGQSKLFLTVKQLNKLLPRLLRIGKRTPKQQVSKKLTRVSLKLSKRAKAKARKQVVTSAAVRAGSLESRGSAARWMERRQGGLPGLGKRR